MPHTILKHGSGLRTTNGEKFDSALLCVCPSVHISTDCVKLLHCLSLQHEVVAIALHAESSWRSPREAVDMRPGGQVQQTLAGLRAALGQVTAAGAAELDAE